MINFNTKNLLEQSFDSYLEHLAHQGGTRLPVHNFRNPTRQFIRFLTERGINDPKKVTHSELEGFQLCLYDERDFSYRSVAAYVREIRLFLDFLLQNDWISRSPIAQVLPRPQLPAKQLSHFYTYEEVFRRYLNDQKKWVSYGHLNNIVKHLNGFIRYLIANEVKSVYTVTESTFLKYREYLWDEFVHDRTVGLVARSQKERLRSVVRLFRYLSKEGILKANPAEQLDWEEYYKEIIKKAETLPEMPLENNDLTQLDEFKIKFLSFQQTIGKSKHTTQHYRKGIEVFYEFLEEKGISNLAQVNKQLLLDYYNFMLNYVGFRGNPASNAYKNNLLWSLKLFFRFLVRFDFLAKDPTVDLDSIKEDKGLPRTCMNEKEVFELLNQPQSDDPLSIRDKAIMEVLFSTGVRSNELCSINIEDVDFQQEMIRVNFPKGGAGYQRIIPVGQIALDCLQTYLKEARPQIANGDGKALFLSYKGHRLQNEAVLNVVKKYTFQCGIRKNVTPHSFRVTCATMMLKNGADIRHVQEQLGHKKITSTQIYTRLNPTDLKSVHKRCHPREKKIASN